MHFGTLVFFCKLHLADVIIFFPPIQFVFFWLSGVPEIYFKKMCNLNFQILPPLLFYFRLLNHVIAYFFKFKISDQFYMYLFVLVRPIRATPDKYRLYCGVLTYRLSSIWGLCLVEACCNLKLLGARPGSLE